MPPQAVSNGYDLDALFGTVDRGYCPKCRIFASRMCSVRILAELPGSGAGPLPSPEEKAKLMAGRGPVRGSAGYEGSKKGAA
jgi:hypothetical protein